MSGAGARAPLDVTLVRATQGMRAIASEWVEIANQLDVALVAGKRAKQWLRSMVDRYRPSPAHRA